MSDEPISEEQEKGRGKPAVRDKEKEHSERILRTAVACIMGIITGAVSFALTTPDQVIGLNSYTMFGLVLMLAGIVVQRHIFMALRMDPMKLGKKDWFYQGFMTFAFWFITWTLLLTPEVL
ncbi:MAG: hypothetical protein LUQ25_07610 [Methanoregulaceae archaeon]|nr:hypothetical protein [Methanoregulaceae archaeon]